MKFPPDYAARHDNNDAPQDPASQGIGHGMSLEEGLHHDANQVEHELQKQLSHSGSRYFRLTFQLLAQLGGFEGVRLRNWLQINVSIF